MDMSLSKLWEIVKDRVASTEFMVLNVAPIIRREEFHVKVFALFLKNFFIIEGFIQQLYGLCDSLR